MNTLAIAVVLLLIDASMPLMYSVFRVDKTLSSTKSKAFKSKYKLVSFPRSALLLAFIVSIIFAPQGAENSPIYISLFLALAAAYIFCVFIDLKKAYPKSN